MVLKIPDGSFSRGVAKVGNRAELERMARGMLEDSDLILAQEFMSPNMTGASACSTASRCSSRST